MPAALDVLAARYADVPGIVRRAGRTYPVAMTPAPGAVVVLDDARVLVDAGLAAGGRAHLDAVRAGGRVHDGGVLCLVSVDTGSRPATVRVAEGGYFDMLATCDAVRAELVDVATGGPDVPDLPLRRRAHAVAGDPVVSGHGRAAAVGVSVLLTVPHGAGRGVVVGRRSERVGTDPGRWHVAPSGMLERAADGRHVAVTVATELREELGVDLPADDVAARLRVLGVVTDLLRLRPDVVVRLDLEEPVDLVRGAEFDALEVVPLTPDGLANLWRRRPPGAVTSPAAGALGLLERDLAAAT